MQIYEAQPGIMADYKCGCRLEMNRFVISRYEVHSLISCKYMDHNLEFWLIRNRDVPDLAASLYNMLGFQI